MAGITLERARGCMVAAGIFFKKGAEDISQSIELGLQIEQEPEALYQKCMQRESADRSVLATTSLIIFFTVRDGLRTKQASLAAWKVLDRFHDPIIKSIAGALRAADKQKNRGKFLARLLSSEDMQDELSLAIFLNCLSMEDTFHAHLQEFRKQERVNVRIMAAAFAGAWYGLKEVNASQ